MKYTISVLTVDPSRHINNKLILLLAILIHETKKNLNVNVSNYSFERSYVANLFSFPTKAIICT